MDTLSSTVIHLVSILSDVAADRYVAQLLESLLMDYNKDVRPVKNSSDPLQVKFGANLCRLIDVVRFQFYVSLPTDQVCNFMSW